MKQILIILQNNGQDVATMNIVDMGMPVLGFDDAMEWIKGQNQIFKEQKKTCRYIVREITTNEYHA